MEASAVRSALAAGHECRGQQCGGRTTGHDGVHRHGGALAAERQERGDQDSAAEHAGTEDGRPCACAFLALLAGRAMTADG